MASFTLGGLLSGSAQLGVVMTPLPWPQGLVAPAVADAIATHARAITPSDTFYFPSPCRFLWVGGAGALVVTMPDTNVVTIAAVPAGTKLPLSVIQVRSTGTVASSIVAGW
jgi:hypothetical protein